MRSSVLIPCLLCSALLTAVPLRAAPAIPASKVRKVAERISQGDRIEDVATLKAMLGKVLRSPEERDAYFVKALWANPEPYLNSPELRFCIRALNDYSNRALAAGDYKRAGESLRLMLEIGAVAAGVRPATPGEMRDAPKGELIFSETPGFVALDFLFRTLKAHRSAEGSGNRKPSFERSLAASREALRGISRRARQHKWPTSESLTLLQRQIRALEGTLVEELQQPAKSS